MKRIQEYRVKESIMKKRTSSSRSVFSVNDEERWLECIVKGFANHRRIRILRLLNTKPDLTLSGICDYLHMEFKSGSEHVLKMRTAGLVSKRKQLNNVHHNITGRGRQILSFLKSVK